MGEMVSPSRRHIAAVVLVVVWCSLRFADAQHCSPTTSLSLQQHTIRGFCDRTKSTTRGQPFAGVAFGLLGQWGGTLFSRWCNPRAVPQRWTTSYRLTADCAAKVRRFAESAEFEWDRPATRFQALLSLRSLMQEFAQSQPSASVCGYTVHSMKTTLLSYARQLQLPQPWWLQQGHHRVATGHSSVSLYSRDDVHDALHCAVAKAARSGWRPVTPIWRRAAPPLIDVDCCVPFSAFRFVWMALIPLPRPLQKHPKFWILLLLQMRVTPMTQMQPLLTKALRPWRRRFFPGPRVWRGASRGAASHKHEAHSLV